MFKVVDKITVLSYVIKDTASKHQFGNEFSTDRLKEMGLYQSLDQIKQLITISKKRENSKMIYQIGFAPSISSNKETNSTQQNRLSKKYKNGDSLHVIVSITEAWFSGVFTFELKKQGKCQNCLSLFFYCQTIAQLTILSKN